jgi:hypothetical protein
MTLGKVNPNELSLAVAKRLTGLHVTNIRKHQCQKNRIHQ